MPPPVPAVRTYSDVEMYKRLLGYLRPYRFRFGLVIVSMVVTALAEPALAALVKPLLDGSFVEKDPFYIKYVPIAIFAAALVRALGNFTISVGMGWVTGKVAVDMRTELFGKIVMLPSSFYQKQPSGHTTARVINFVNQMRDAATNTLIPLVRDSVTIIALLSWMLFLNWKLSMTILVLAPLITGVIVLVSRRLRKLSRSMQEISSDMLHTVDESITNQAAVKIFLAQEQEKRKLGRVFNQLRHLGFKFGLASAGSGLAVQLLSAIALSSVVYFSALQSLDGEVSVGAFVSFFGAMALLLSPIKRLTQINQQLQKGLAAAESIFEILDMEDEPSGNRNLQQRVRGALEFQNVSFTYPGHEELVLKDVSFKVEPNETIAIVGLSGSGKTTIASIIPLLQRPSEGRVLIDGVDTRELSLESLRNQIGYVTQELFLFNDSVRANIAYGCNESRKEGELSSAAKAAHVSEFVDDLPQGFGTPIGQNGNRLSGGQRQRLAIARTLLKDPPIMIFDEATSALDTESERKVQQAIQNIGKQRTLVVIAHRLSTIRNADRIIVLDGGVVVEEGAHEDLMAKKGKYFTLYSLMSSQNESGVVA